MRPQGPEPHSGTEVPPHMSVAGRLRAYFFAGILITAPVAITFYIAWLFISFVDERIGSLIPEQLNPQRWGVPGLGLLIVAAVLTLIGALTAGYAGRVVVRASDMILARMPVIRSIYSATKQVFETVLAQRSAAFREVVLIEYPRRGIWTLAFITGNTSGEVQAHSLDELVNVFVPTTPNPTSGFLLFVPRKDMHVLKMSVEDGIKMVISGGIITPPEPEPLEPAPQSAALPQDAN